MDIFVFQLISVVHVRYSNTFLAFLIRDVEFQFIIHNDFAAISTLLP